MEFFPSILHVRQICKTLKYVSYGAALGRASRGSIGWIFHGSNCATDHYCGISHSGNLYFSAYFLIFSTYFPRGCTLVVLQPSSGTKISNNREESNTLLARQAVRSVVDFAFCNIWIWYKILSSRKFEHCSKSGKKLVPVGPEVGYVRDSFPRKNCWIGRPKFFGTFS